MKNKIVIDLDIITVALWDKRGKNVETAKKFIERTERKEFDVITPFILLELVSKWKYERLKEDIEDFYVKQSTTMLTNRDLDARIDKLNIDDKAVLNELKSHSIKEEDALIVFITSLFELDFLVTFNRKHLRSKETSANEVLRKHGLKEIKIRMPDEI